MEEWLVKAMGKKLIEGQMDQVKQQVIITKSSYRTFGPEHWQILQNQLAAWKVTLLSCWLNNHGKLTAISGLTAFLLLLILCLYKTTISFLIQVSVEAVRELVSHDEASGLRAIPNGVRA